MIYKLRGERLFFMFSFSYNLVILLLFYCMVNVGLAHYMHFMVFFRMLLLCHVLMYMCCICV